MTTTYTFTRKTHHAILKIGQRPMVFLIMPYAHRLTKKRPWKLDTLFTTCIYLKKKQVSACLFQCWNNLYSMKGKSMLLQGKPFRYFHVKSLQYITNLCSNFQSYANNNYTTLTMISTCVIFGTISKNELTKTVVLFMVWCKVCRCLKIIN